MSDSRPRRAKALFERVLDLPREERDAFLREACGSDHALEEDVRSLVEAHQESEGFLESGEVGRALADISSADNDPLIGANIGDYRVIGLLARGGMGAVYRAEQEHPHREVALKLIDRGVTRPENLRRFEVEAQVLARLKHPGIAQIHVAGTTGAEHGERPYFAMELVDGLSLTSFADDGGLGLRDRLELLIRVCDAVQHAHQVGVIHRDLKPANILVTAEGQPKILDFGIARSTDADLQVNTMADGGTLLLGTLPYMSPEQVRGDPDELDTRADVHALGVLAYELLTGSLPRELEGKTLTDAIRTLVETEPRTLRAAAGERFPADLETIVARALESDRHRRYDSASGLAEDLRRFLDGQPINARPQSAVYQLRKLISRNCLPAALVTGIVLLAVGSAVVMAIQTGRIARERDRVGLEAVTANEVSTFLESLFLQADPERALGETLTARDILDRGTSRIETELRDQPAVRGRLLAVLGKVYDGLGEEERAAPLLQEAVDIGRVLRAEQEEATDPSNLRLALCMLARRYSNQGRNEEAVSLCREAVGLSSAIDGEESAAYATCLNHLVYHLTLVSAYDEARVQIERALALRERLLGPEHYEVGWSVYQYAHLLRASGEKEQARERYQRACAIWEKVLPENHPQLAMGLRDYSQLLVDLEEYDEALIHAERALAIQEETLGWEHPAIANTLNDLGYLHWKKGELGEALHYFTDAVEAHRISLGPADPGMLDRLQNLVHVHHAMNRQDQVETVFREALDLAREHHGQSPELLGTALARLGFHCLRRGREAEARTFLEEAAEVYRAEGEPHLNSLLTMQNALASMLGSEDEDEVAEALALYQEILATELEHPGLEMARPLFTRWQIGVGLVRLGWFEDAERHLRELLEDVQGSFEANAFFPWNIRWLLGHCRHGLGFAGEARALYDEVLEVDPQGLNDDLYWLRLRRAEDHVAGGRLDEARRELRAALGAGLEAGAGRQAIQANPGLGPSESRELLLVIDGQ